MKKGEVIILCLAVVVFILNNIGTTSFFESYYSIFYEAIRWIYNKTFFYLPFPMFYPVLALIIYFFYSYVIKKIAVKKWKMAMKSLIVFILAFYVSFYVLWGFNYHRPDLTQRLKMEIPVIDSQYVQSEIDLVHSNLILLRRNLVNDNENVNEAIYGITLEESLRKTEIEILPQLGLKALPPFRIRALYPKGILLILSTAGIYIPFDLEGHYDAGLHFMQKPFVIAHEMGHGYGITDEADCNFLAYLTCKASDNKYIQYTGLLTYYRYLTAYLKYHAPYSFGKMYFNRNASIQKDMNVINEEMEKYPDVMPEIRNFIYDSFLKINGVEEGMASYDRVVELVAAYKSRK